MSGWTLLQFDASASGGVHTLYELYGHATPGASAPFAAWYLKRTQTRASALGDGTRKTIDYASWANVDAATTANSAAAWTQRATLTFSSDLVPADYSGDPDLLQSLAPTSQGGSSMSYLAELTPVTLLQNGWTRVSDAMANDKTYRLALTGQATGKVAISASQPAVDAVIGFDIGHQAKDRLDISAPVRFSGTPVWVFTPYRDAQVQILEVAA